MPTKPLIIQKQQRIKNLYIDIYILILVNATGQAQINQQIDFTDNWFIDISILGFINFMEDVTERKLKNMKWKESDV